MVPSKCPPSGPYKDIYEVNICKDKPDTLVNFDIIGKELNKQNCKLLNNQILYFSNKDKGYVYAGVYGKANEEVMVPIGERNEIMLRYRKVANKELFVTQDKDKKSSRRGNERRIGEVVSLVTRWKELQGKLDENSERYSLETAAKKIKVSKKTLDDYYKQIQLGLQNKFDFNYYRDSLMGVLRHFNVQAKLSKRAYE